MEPLFNVRTFRYADDLCRFININKITQAQIVSITEVEFKLKLFFYHNEDFVVDQYQYLDEERKEKFRSIKEFLDRYNKSHIYENLFPVDPKYDPTCQDFNEKNYNGDIKKPLTPKYDLFDFIKEFQEWGTEEFQD